MSEPSDLIAQARALDARLEAGPWVVGNNSSVYCPKSKQYPVVMPYGVNNGDMVALAEMRNIFPLLTDLAEQRGAMLIGMEAIRRYQKNHPTNQEWEALQDQYYKEAQEALDIESSSWRKIDPSEKK